MNALTHKLADAFGFDGAIGTDVSVSFEFFPPKTEGMEKTLWSSIKRLEPLNPHFVSVTYGAGGTTRERTHKTVTRILDETSLTPASHLTCVGASKDEIDDIVRNYHAHGVRHIVALRGDPPEGQTRYAPHPHGYANGAELTAGIKRVAPDIDVSVSCYPERHPDSPDWDIELDNLKRKVDAGASRAISQFFFDVPVYAEMVERVRRENIDIPLVPGIIPVLNYKQVAKFAKMAGASIPPWLGELYDGLDQDEETRKMVAAMVAADQVRKLYAMGVRDFHFYTLNRADLTYAICHILGIRQDRQPGEEGQS